MNEIETMFYSAYVQRMEEYKEDWGMISQKTIGIYKVDFYIPSFNIAIEIDGHEFHKTKEQREKDYVKGRYLQKKVVSVIRFMGTEVYLDPDACIGELKEILDAMKVKYDHVFDQGIKIGRQTLFDK
jgi:very-short-patch-repair endonuclease